MRVAILITGQMRDYQVNLENHLKQIIHPNNADVFVYACNKNTIHTIGSSTNQKYNITSTEDSDALEQQIRESYGTNLKEVVIEENENLDDSDFGTLGYFKKRMNNQMSNIRKGYLMAVEHSQKNGFQYDVIVRCRPDNSMFLKPVLLKDYKIEDGVIHSTVYPSGHRDPWFFSFSNPSTFNEYCSFVYMDGEDETRTDDNFDCPEVALEKYLSKIGKKTILVPSICRPFYAYDKTQPITEFPFVRWSEKLLDSEGNWVDIPNSRTDSE